MNSEGTFRWFSIGIFKPIRWNRNEKKRNDPCSEASYNTIEIFWNIFFLQFEILIFFRNSSTLVGRFSLSPIWVYGKMPHFLVTCLSLQRFYVSRDSHGSIISLMDPSSIHPHSWINCLKSQVLWWWWNGNECSSEFLTSTSDAVATDRYFFFTIGRKVRPHELSNFSFLPSSNMFVMNNL